MITCSSGGPNNLPTYMLPSLAYNCTNNGGKLTFSRRSGAAHGPRPTTSRRSCCPAHHVGPLQQVPNSAPTDCQAPYKRARPCQPLPVVARACSCLAAVRTYRAPTKGKPTVPLWLQVPQVLLRRVVESFSASTSFFRALLPLPHEPDMSVFLRLATSYRPNYAIFARDY